MKTEKRSKQLGSRAKGHWWLVFLPIFFCFLHFLGSFFYQQLMDRCESLTARSVLYFLFVLLVASFGCCCCCCCGFVILDISLCLRKKRCHWWRCGGSSTCRTSCCRPIGWRVPKFLFRFSFFFLPFRLGRCRSTEAINSKSISDRNEVDLSTKLERQMLMFADWIAFYCVFFFRSAN